MEMSAKITIYIPVYNGADYIQYLIDSVLSQTYQNIFLVISDNCSTDDTVYKVNPYLSDKRVELIKQPFNVGMLKNFNYCLDRTKTDYCMVMSHDDFFYDDRALEVGIEILERNKNIPAVYNYMMFVDEMGKPITENKYKYAFNGLTSADFVAKKSIMSCRNLFGIPLLIRTSAIKNLRFSEGFNHTGDVDFSISLTKQNQIYYIPKPLLAIRFHSNNATARNYSKFLPEFKKLAIKHHIKLSKFEQMQMYLNHFLTVIQKYLFYFYLDKIRKSRV
jgi:glycosyltransferase involved in cell wall biosynthesis